MKKLFLSLCLVSFVAGLVGAEETIEVKFFDGSSQRVPKVIADKIPLIQGYLDSKPDEATSWDVVLPELYKKEPFELLVNLIAAAADPLMEILEHSVRSLEKKNFIKEIAQEFVSKVDSKTLLAMLDMMRTTCLDEKLQKNIQRFCAEKLKNILQDKGFLDLYVAGDLQTIATVEVVSNLNREGIALEDFGKYPADAMIIFNGPTVAKKVSLSTPLKKESKFKVTNYGDRAPNQWSPDGQIKSVTSTYVNQHVEVGYLEYEDQGHYKTSFFRGNIELCTVIDFRCLGFSPNSRYAFLGREVYHSYGKVNYIDLLHPEKGVIYLGHSVDLLSPDSRFALITDHEKAEAFQDLFDLEQGRKIEYFHFGPDFRGHFSLSNNCLGTLDRVYNITPSGYRGNTWKGSLVHLYDIQNKQVIFEKETSEKIYEMALSPNGLYLALSYYDRIVIRPLVEGFGKKIEIKNQRKESSACLRFTVDQKELVIDDSTIITLPYYYRVPTQEEQRQLTFEARQLLGALAERNTNVIVESLRPIYDTFPETIKPRYKIAPMDSSKPKSKTEKLKQWMRQRLHRAPQPASTNRCPSGQHPVGACACSKTESEV